MSPKYQNQQSQHTEPASPWTLVYQTSQARMDNPTPSPWDIDQEPTHTALTSIYDHTQRNQDS